MEAVMVAGAKSCAVIGLSGLFSGRLQMNHSEPFFMRKAICCLALRLMAHGAVFELSLYRNDES